MRDADSDRRSRHHRQGGTSRSTPGTGLAQQSGAIGGARTGPSAGCSRTGECQARRQEEGRSNIWDREGHLRQSLHKKAAMIQKDGESHKVDYTRVRLETPILAGHPEDIVYHTSYIKSGITVAHVAASSASKPNSAQKAPDGSAPLRKFTAP